MTLTILLLCSLCCVLSAFSSACPQAYSFVSIDVHGASGLDHFVHRFTHRVVRGVLLAVGRPDGRLSCLSKPTCCILHTAYTMLIIYSERIQ